jgi:hypothetical protein
MGGLLGCRDGEALPVIDWDRLQDDCSEERVGYSFLSDERNVWLGGDGWVLRRILGDAVRKARWFQDGDNPYRAEAVRQYGMAVEDFRERLLVLMHLIGGQPARAPEIMGLRMHNTGQGGIRNIFVQNGLISGSCCRSGSRCSG